MRLLNHISLFQFNIVCYFNIAVLRPAKDKLHPPLFIIGLGKLNLSGSPFSANFSNLDRLEILFLKV